MKRILLIQTASIGDVILITPAIENVHLSFPETEIDILVKKGCESLFNNHPFINNVVVWDKKSGKYRALFQLIKKIRKNKYDAVVSFQRFFSSGLITILSGARIKAGFNKNPLSCLFTQKINHKIGNAQDKLHETERNLELISLITKNKEGTVRLYPSESDYSTTALFKTGNYICIAPASLWFTKQLPVSKWVDFLKSIDKSIKVLMLGSANDEKICNEIINLSRHDEAEVLCGKLSFLESAALMQYAMMNYVNDSAPMHLASSVNAPVTAIYCSTVPAFGFGPLSEKSFIVQTDEELPCKPCGLHGFNACPEKHFKCALTIDINELNDKLSL